MHEQKIEWNKKKSNNKTGKGNSEGKTAKKQANNQGIIEEAWTKTGMK